MRVFCAKGMTRARAGLWGADSSLWFPRASSGEAFNAGEPRALEVPMQLRVILDHRDLGRDPRKGLNQE